MTTDTILTQTRSDHCFLCLHRCRHRPCRPHSWCRRRTGWCQHPDRVPAMVPGLRHGREEPGLYFQARQLPRQRPRVSFWSIARHWENCTSLPPFLPGSTKPTGSRTVDSARSVDSETQRPDRVPRFYSDMHVANTNQQCPRICPRV